MDFKCEVKIYEERRKLAYEKSLAHYFCLPQINSHWLQEVKHFIYLELALVTMLCLCFVDQTEGSTEALSGTSVHLHNSQCLQFVWPSTSCCMALKNLSVSGSFMASQRKSVSGSWITSIAWIFCGFSSVGWRWLSKATWSCGTQPLDLTDGCESSDFTLNLWFPLVAHSLHNSCWLLAANLEAMRFLMG